VYYVFSFLRNTAPGYLLLLLLFCIEFCGCRKQPESTATRQPKPPEPPRISEVHLKSFKPNEAGAVMILMYHDFDPKRKNGPLNRTPDQFRKDLENLYKRNYRPVTVSEFVENRMDLPAGKSPVILTFDDAKPTQFRVIIGSDGQPHIDPDCAIGILETFEKKHPDWKSKGTFFVLPKEGRNGDPFGQPDSVADKFGYLLSHGYEIANHTSTHSSLRRMPSDKIQWELATAVHNIRQIAPKATMDVLALPYGHLPRKEAIPYLRSGKYGGTKYAHKAVLLAAWRPVLSPITKAQKKYSQAGSFCLFNPYALERITPDPNPKGGQTFEYWLKYFDQNPGQRYVSDGNPQVVAVPKSMIAMVNEAAVKKQGKVLQVYSFALASGGGAGLSVENSSH
jgi:peptidoglycan/xylan/chitin deacetylase (PgdA/CDA1 family)